MNVVSIAAAVLIAFASVTARAQAPVTYEDVAVIININDSNSVRIGEYFAQQRNLPATNVIRVDVAATETISPGQFDTLRQQVEEYLLQNNLQDTINYIVTTKGVPLRVDFGGSLYDPDWRNASVDAELMLILGPLANHIGQNTVLIPPSSLRVHPYFRRDQHFDRNAVIAGTSPPLTYGMYLVTRLTGLTSDDVLQLIDRSGPFTLVDKDSAVYVFDRDPLPIDKTYDDNQVSASQLLTARGWNSLLNSDSVYVTGQRNVLGYTSWGSNDHYDHHYTQFARPGNHWLPGSLAETYVSTSARNFTPGQTGGQSRIADLIAEGCTGASGYVFEPYSFTLTWVNQLFDRYTRGYNLAESYYMSSPTMSWMVVIVGDPKTSIVTERPPVPAPVVNVPSPVCTGAPVTLQASGALEGTMNWFLGSYQEVLNAGAPLDRSHPLWIGSTTVLSHSFDTAGDAAVTFVNENYVGLGYAEARFEVLESPTAAITASMDTVFLDEDPTVLFTSTGTNASSFSWDFGDGTSSSEQHPTHTYTTAGAFTVSLQASNGACTASDAIIVVVFETRVPLVASSSLIDFGSVRLNESATRQLTLHNLLSVPLTLQSLQLGGAHLADFSVQAQFPMTIPARDSVVLDVTFMPAATGERRASAVVNAGLQSEVTVTLVGNGEPATTGLEEAQPRGFALLQSYPNPVGGSRADRIATFTYALPTPMPVSLKVFDALGREAAVLFDGWSDAGMHTLGWSASGLPAGMYLIRLEAGGRVLTNRMTVLD